jgi:hypothetical protein
MNVEVDRQLLYRYNSEITASWLTAGYAAVVIVMTIILIVVLQTAELSEVNQGLLLGVSAFMLTVSVPIFMGTIHHAVKTKKKEEKILDEYRVAKVIHDLLKTEDSDSSMLSSLSSRRLSGIIDDNKHVKIMVTSKVTPI